MKTNCGTLDCGICDVCLEEIAEQDICGFCGEPGADKIPHPILWPGEQSAGTAFVHADCEDDECARAHDALSYKERIDFLLRIK